MTSFGIVGAGPAGLRLAALLKEANPGGRVTVWERNRVADPYGFGIVLSDQAQQGIRERDEPMYRELRAGAVAWDTIDVGYRGEVVRSTGHAFLGVSRRHLLDVLLGRCLRAGVEIVEGTPAPELSGYDVVVGADGVNSGVRNGRATEFGTTVTSGACRYLWAGSDVAFPSLIMAVLETPFGLVQMHGYPHDRGQSTVVVEMHDSVWRAAGFRDPVGRQPGESDMESLARCEELLAPVLGGGKLLGSNSAWLTFETVRNERWSAGNVVLAGDAAHTTHFSIGSGTKLALEDAEALADALAEHRDVPAAFAAYEQRRRPNVQSLQRAADASRRWFENVQQYTAQPVAQFVFNLLTRSRRVTYRNLQERDTTTLARAETVFREAAETAEPVPPMFQPFRLRGMRLANRVMVSPMAVYSAQDGCINDFHLVHLGSRALGGAGLVMTEMVAPVPDGRITPQCAGLYRGEHEDAFRRLVTFVHEHSRARIGIQLGHAGRKGSTRVMWEGMDEPLHEGNWPLLGPSALPYLPHSQVPREMTRADMDEVREAFVRATRAAAAIGFDLLELHCAHGYLLSSFITPVSNRRTDRYGGSLANRLRFPVEVCAAVRDAWPADRPLSVRISATDWVPDGLTGADSVEVARAFVAAGADIIDVSTGQTSPAARPEYGRSYQVPYADAIRNQLGVPTIAVGGISSAEDVNTTILAGRADICALGRTSLYDPAWPLHAAAEQEIDSDLWPEPFRAGSRRPAGARS